MKPKYFSYKMAALCVSHYLLLFYLWIVKFINTHKTQNCVSKRHTRIIAVPIWLFSVLVLVVVLLHLRIQTQFCSILLQYIRNQCGFCSLNRMPHQMPLSASVLESRAQGLLPNTLSRKCPPTLPTTLKTRNSAISKTFSSFHQRSPAAKLLFWINHEQKTKAGTCSKSKVPEVDKVLQRNQESQLENSVDKSETESRFGSESANYLCRAGTQTLLRTYICQRQSTRN